MTEVSKEPAAAKPAAAKTETVYNWSAAKDKLPTLTPTNSVVEVSPLVLLKGKGITPTHGYVRRILQGWHTGGKLLKKGDLQFYSQHNEFLPAATHWAPIPE